MGELAGDAFTEKKFKELATDDVISVDKWNELVEDHKSKIGAKEEEETGKDRGAIGDKTTPNSVSVQKVTAAAADTCQLEASENELMLGIFNKHLATYRNSSVQQMLEQLHHALQQESHAAIVEACDKPVPTFGAEELRRVLAYADFAREVLGHAKPLELEVRIEGWKAYCLVPPEATILRTAAEKSLLWVHDEAWAKERFFDGGKDLGLCGQVLGTSKFVTPCTSMPSSKLAALDTLGLRGYETFDKPGVLYVVRATLPSSLLKEARPMVPLVYNVGRANDAAATAPELWEPELHFQEGTIPGFTSGLKAELVMKTFKVDVHAAAELKNYGLSCVGLADD